MGTTTSTEKEEKQEAVDLSTNVKESSTGFHVFEFHGPTVGWFLGLILGGLMLFYLWRRYNNKQKKRAAQQMAALYGASPFPPPRGVNTIPFHLDRLATYIYGGQDDRFEELDERPPPPPRRVRANRGLPHPLPRGDGGHDENLDGSPAMARA